MGSLGWVTNDLGLLALTMVVSALSAYLVYTMLHPERV
jgi:F subunit of K+-transporting ATPase (Potass_KdpF)